MIKFLLRNSLFIASVVTGLIGIGLMISGIAHGTTPGYVAALIGSLQTYTAWSVVARSLNQVTTTTEL